MEIISALKTSWFVISALWLMILSIDWLRRNKINQRFVKCGIIIIMAIFVLTGYFSTNLQFEVWKNDPMSRFFLPPNQSMDYFYQYSFYHFWFPYVLDLAISLGWVFCLILLSRYSGKRFLDEKDITLGFFTSIIIGWPRFIIYLLSLFGLLAAKQIFNYYILKKRDLIQMSPYMILSSLIVLALTLALNDQFGLDKLKLVS
ncbi:MAG: hypothetical protein WA063_01750 [Minisyncoccia bacterium]